MQRSFRKMRVVSWPIFALSLFQTLPAAAIESNPLPLVPERTLSFKAKEGTWMSLDVSPDGTLMVFDLLGDIYVMPMEGGQAKRLTHGMAFDAQPVFSRDGSRIAFVSDRTGTENIWTIAADGTDARQETDLNPYHAVFSPEWSADGKAIYASIFRPDLHGNELWKFDIGGSMGSVLLMPVDTGGGVQSVTGIAPVPDGNGLYFAYLNGGLSLDHAPSWTINHSNNDGSDNTVVIDMPPRSGTGSFFRPVVSPDGRQLVYGTRKDGQTGLRIRNLVTGYDKWLAYPVQHDQLFASHLRDILPRYDFTPDSKSLVISQDGGFKKIDVASGKATDISFTADVDIGLGPSLRQSITAETGPVQVRLIQSPELSQDGKKLAFTALDAIYTKDLTSEAEPKRFSRVGEHAFHPSWDVSGESLAYVTWDVEAGGHIYVSAEGFEQPKQVTDMADFYSYPIFSSDGKYIYAYRASHQRRLQTYMEYGDLKPQKIIRLSLETGQQDVLAEGTFGGKLDLSRDGGSLRFMTPTGLTALSIEDKTLQTVVNATSANWYFASGPAQAAGIVLSPDGTYALASTMAQQLYLFKVPESQAEIPSVDLAAGTQDAIRLTNIGADYFGWSADGKSVYWSIGNSFYQRPLEDILSVSDQKLDQEVYKTEDIVIQLPRDIPTGSLVLRGATAITMDGDRIIEAADIFIRDNVIEAVVHKNARPIPADIKQIDISGKFVIPGLIDTHHHLASIRRDILDTENWELAATLSYGITTIFDPSTLSIDAMPYQDLVETGQMVGSRIFSTGPAIFSFNEFQSREEVESVVRRYRDKYRLRNLKMYKIGNRRVRQWVADVSRELGIMPTAEGGLAMKHGLTYVMDGFAGHEHALPVAPLSNDVVQLMADTEIGYTLTLMITHGGPEGQDYFISHQNPLGDAKMERFWPHSGLEMKFSERPWHAEHLYYFPEIADSAAAISRKGGLIGIGAHGNFPGIGTHWEMQAYAMGGFTADEILKAATIHAAKIIGRDTDLGSLSSGKLADLIILDDDPRADIRNSLSIHYVMKNGRLYAGDSLDEVWPRQTSYSNPWIKLN